ncbi:MAG: alpha/beta hydrolase [Ktedonobacterales bacterium]
MEDVGQVKAGRDMGATVEYNISFPSAGRPPLLLEGVLARPAESSAGPQAGAILCHPQPATSTLDDPLLRRLASSLATAGLLALRFNFRGVAGSQGQQTDGRLEPLDVAGAMDFLLAQPQINPGKLCIVGHAFGAYIALAYAAHDPRVRTIVAVSPPIFRVTPDLGMFERPKLFLTGEYDEVSPRYKLEPWIERLPNRRLNIVSGARHLMRGYEDIAAASITSYLVRWAITPGM